MKIALIALAGVVGLFLLTVFVWKALHIFGRFRRWKASRVRAFELGTAPDYPFYVRLTPNFGMGIRWFRGDRLRVAPQHGVQITRWSPSGVWFVRKQLLFKSTVKGERFI
jgi:hypothetical protein